VRADLNVHNARVMYVQNIGGENLGYTLTPRAQYGNRLRMTPFRPGAGHCRLIFCAPETGGRTYVNGLLQIQLCRLRQAERGVRFQGRDDPDGEVPHMRAVQTVAGASTKEGGSTWPEWVKGGLTLISC